MPVFKPLKVRIDPKSDGYHFLFYVDENGDPHLLKSLHPSAVTYVWQGTLYGFSVRGATSPEDAYEFAKEHIRDFRITQTAYRWSPIDGSAEQYTAGEVVTNPYIIEINGR